MSDIINNLLLTEKTNSVSSQITSEQTLKETPSLFDSLLVASSSKDEIIVANNQTTESKVENIKVEENSPKVDLDNKLSSTEVQITNENEVNTDKNTDKTTDKTIQTSTSLLDRLVMEAKNNAKDIKSEDLNNKINNTLIETKVQELEVLVDTKESDVVPNDKLNTMVKSDENTTDKTISTTNTLSESDKLIVEAKNKLELDKTEVKNNNKSTILTEEIKSEEIVVSDKATETNSLLDKLINDAKNTLLTDTKEVKVDTTKIEDNKLNLLQEEIKSEEKVVDKTLPTNSLLDRLIIEAKDDVKDIKIKDLTTGVETENSILIKKQLDDLEVSVDANEEVSNKLNTIIKETKNDEVILDNEVVTTKSLLNKLSTDIKNNIKDINQEIKVAVDSNKNIIDESATITDNTIPTEINNVVIINNSDENIDNNVILENKIENKEDASVIIKTDEKLSLMDKLIQKNSEKVTFENIETLSSNMEETEIPLKETITKDLISNIYLGSQKNQVNNQSLFNKNEAITLLKEGNSIQSVKTSAEILELGLENIDIQQAVEDKVEVKKSNIQIDNKNNLIDNLLSKKSIKSEEIKYLITTSVEASKALAENNLNLADDATINVNSPLSYNIQSKIIGAKQQMATMMSDIARQMYENYKPPVTAFRINLNPQDLGSIAILMKNDKNNGLSISMNISNSVTLDTLIENQNVLKNSLNKTFNDNTKFNLDFNSSNENSSNQSSNNQNSQQNKNNQQQMATQSILQLQEENKDREEKIIDYM